MTGEFKEELLVLVRLAARCGAFDLGSLAELFDDGDLRGAIREAAETSPVQGKEADVGNLLRELERQAALALTFDGEE